MTKRETDWAETLNKLERDLLTVGDNTGARINSISLVPTSKVVLVRTADRLNPAKKSEVRTAVLNCLRESCPQAEGSWQVKVQPVHPFPFTSHLSSVVAKPEPSHEISDITQIRTSASAVAALLGCYDELEELAKHYDVVGTFALGGIPGLIHITIEAGQEVVHAAPQNQSAVLKQVQERYHLLPGLQWDDAARAYFGRWISELPRRCSVLLFDTGHVGNAGREASNLLRDLLPRLQSFGPRVVQIISVVDKVTTDQRSECIKIRSRGGDRVRVRVVYRHVPDVVTEDCAKLIGYASQRHELRADSRCDSAVVTLVDDAGHELVNIGAVCAPDALRACTTAFRATADHAAPELEGRILLGFLKDKEVERLTCALSLGLVQGAELPTLRSAVESKYAALAHKVPFYRWDPAKRRVVKRAV